jgi:hypothetical protein
MKLQRVRIPVLSTVAWIIISAVLYFSAVNRYYLFSPSNAYPLRSVTNISGERYEVVRQNSAVYNIELYSNEVKEEAKYLESLLTKKGIQSPTDSPPNNPTAYLNQIAQSLLEADASGNLRDASVLSKEYRRVEEGSGIPSNSSSNEDAIVAKAERSIIFLNKHLDSLYRLPLWLRFADSVCPVKLVDITFCYSEDLQKTGNSASEDSGFRVGMNWLGFLVFVFGPVFILWLLVLLWLWVCPTKIKVPL